MKSRAICTAIVVPGAVTARVDRVIRPTREARELLAEADRIRRERLGTARSASCEPHPNSASRPFRVVSISIYVDELARLDALVAKQRRAGKATANRSAVIRAAVKAMAESST